MKKIVISIQDNSLLISYKHNQIIREDLMNTNIISNEEIVFSDDYLKENINIVLPFFYELCEMNKIDTLVFQSNSLALFLLPYFRKVKIVSIKIKKQETFLYEVYEEILRFGTVKFLDVFTIPNYMFELLDKNGINVTTHSEVFYISPFMEDNHLTIYSNMYYKKDISIFNELTNEDKDDFNTFLRVNRKLRYIKIMKFNINDIKFIFEILNKYKYKYVFIEIYDNITNNQDILKLKELNKKYKHKHIEVGLRYSEEYISANLMKQVNINTLKLSSILLISMVFLIFGYSLYENYLSLTVVNNITDKVNEVIEKSNNNDPIDIVEGYNFANRPIVNKYIASLLQINQDVVGYIKVNNTAVDYPVVKSTDNNFYLKKNLYGEDDRNGWIYMDYRNSDKYLSDNTIIYGHNMYYSGVMFGTLHKVMYYNWYSKPENQIIQFDTMYESMKWQIFSIYTISNTTDYLRVNFETDEEKQAYLDQEVKRNRVKIDTSVSVKDKILTLSTCSGDTERLVIHAKLIEDKKEETTEEPSEENIQKEETN